MYVLVFNDEIAGTADDTSGLPNGFRVYEVTRTPLDQLFYDSLSDQVKPKPPKPNPNDIWDKNQWVTPNVSTIPKPKRMTDLELASQLYEVIKLDNPLYAECFRYLLARIENDSHYADASLLNLETLLSSYTVSPTETPMS